MSSTPPEPPEKNDQDPELPAPLEEILEYVPAERRPAVARMIRIAYSGPLPPSDEMARYKEIDPTFPERFVAMVERQAEHRQKLEAKTVSSEFKLKRRGQDYALVALLVLMVATVALAWLGAYAAAGIVGGSTVLGVVAMFITGRVLEAKSDDDDDDDEIDEDDFPRMPVTTQPTPG